MTVEQLLQRLVELARDGRAQDRVGTEDSRYGFMEMKGFMLRRDGQEPELILVDEEGEI